MHTHVQYDTLNLKNSSDLGAPDNLFDHARVGRSVGEVYSSLEFYFICFRNEKRKKNHNIL